MSGPRPLSARVPDAFVEFFDRHGRAPTMVELIEALGLSAKRDINGNLILYTRLRHYLARAARKGRLAVDYKAKGLAHYRPVDRGTRW